MDCEKNEQLCSVWKHQPSKVTGNADQNPYIVMIRDAQVFEYPGHTIKQEDINQWLATLGPQSPDHRAPLIEWVIEGEKLMMRERERKRSLEHSESNWFARHVPGFSHVEKAFDDVFRPSISYTFYLVGKDNYSKFAKISTFLLLILIPGSILVFIGGISKILDVVDPLPEIKQNP